MCCKFKQQHWKIFCDKKNPELGFKPEAARSGSKLTTVLTQCSSKFFVCVTGVSGVTSVSGVTRAGVTRMSDVTGVAGVIGVPGVTGGADPEATDDVAVATTATSSRVRTSIRLT